MNNPDDEIAQVLDDVLGGWGPATHADLDTSIAVWNALLELGFPYVSLNEDLGGAGGTVEDAFAVLRTLGAHGSGAPLAESGFLAGWLLTTAGLNLEPALRALVPPLGGELTFDGSIVSGRARGVAWVQEADTVVALVDGQGGQFVVELGTKDVLVANTMQTVAGEPRSDLRVDAVTPVRVATAGTNRGEYLRRAAATRVALIAGALERARDLTVTYTNERIQFGQAVAKFQAVQVHLARLAEDAALVGAASELLAASAEEGIFPSFEVASATLLARSSAREAAKAAHQAHGAMGVTREYPLHVITRHLWQWSHEFASSSIWQQTVLDAVRDAGADDYYPLITGGSNWRRQP